MTSESPWFAPPRSRCAASRSAIRVSSPTTRIDLDIRPGEIHALLGENGAGKTTLMNILYGLARPDDGQILLDGQAVQPDGPVRCHRSRHQHGPPALHARARADRGREHRPRRRDDRPRRLPRPEGGRPPDHGARSAVRVRGRPRGQGRIPVRRLAAARRDPQGPLPRREGPRPRRADGRPHAPGDRGDLRGPAPPGGRGPQHHLHQPQAVRGPRDRRPDHGHPARQGRRRADPVRDQRGGPGRADGRARGLADRRSRRVTPRGRCTPGQRPASSRDDRGNEVVHGVDLEVRAGEILGIAGVAGNGQDELVEAHRRACASRPAAR